MNKKVFVTRTIPQVGIDMLRKKGYEVDVNGKDRALSPRELVKTLRAKPYDAVLSLLTDKIDGPVFDAARTAKIYANYAAGFDNIDLSEARKRGIVVTNTPGVSSLAVAEHAVALMLALATRVAEGDEFMRAGKYRGWEPSLLIGTDLSGKTVGLIGVGNIGSEVARIMKNGFGANIVYYDVNPNEIVERSYGARRMATVEDVLRTADFVSLHVPLLDSTRHLIDETHLSLMKPTAFLINTSRGAVIDEKALVKALQNKKIAGAGLDVYEFEPKLTKGLIKLPNVVLTPHIASARESVRNAMAVLAAQNIIDFLETGSAKNKVN